jgi:hypothetical protein
MAPEVVLWKKKRVLVLDVEGTGDGGADPAHEMALMMIARLVSSVLVYNTNDGPPSREQVGKLSFRFFPRYLNFVFVSFVFVFSFPL